MFTQYAIQSLFALLFQNIEWEGIGDTNGLRGSFTPGNFMLSLHSDNPVDADAYQITHELAYTGYARVAVSRSFGFAVAEDYAQNSGIVAFPACTGGVAVATYVGLGLEVSGNGILLAAAEIIYPVGGLAISENIVPQISAGNLKFKLVEVS